MDHSWKPCSELTAVLPARKRPPSYRCKGEEKLPDRHLPAVNGGPTCFLYNLTPEVENIGGFSGLLVDARLTQQPMLLQALVFPSHSLLAETRNPVLTNATFDLVYIMDFHSAEATFKHGTYQKQTERWACHLKKSQGEPNVGKFLPMKIHKAQGSITEIWRSKTKHGCCPRGRDRRSGFLHRWHSVPCQDLLSLLMFGTRVLQVCKYSARKPSMENKITGGRSNLNKEIRNFICTLGTTIRKTVPGQATVAEFQPPFECSQDINVVTVSWCVSHAEASFYAHILVCKQMSINFKHKLFNSSFELTAMNCIFKICCLSSPFDFCLHDRHVRMWQTHAFIIFLTCQTLTCSPHWHQEAEHKQYPKSCPDSFPHYSPRQTPSPTS